MAADDQRPTDDKDAAVRDWAQAARWAQRWRQLAAEALDVARAMTDPEARRYMRFLAESYRRLADRAELRKTRLAGLLNALPAADLPGFDPTLGTDTTEGGEGPRRHPSGGGA